MENSDLLLLLFGILIILVFIMGLFFSTPQSSQDNESYSDEGKKEEVKKDGEQEPKPTPKQSIKRDDDKEINKKIFLENQKFLEDNDNDDPLYIKVLFETGLLYEKLYKDYFRGTVGIPHYYKQDCWVHNTCLYIDDFKDNNPLYLYYLLKNVNLTKVANSTGVPTLNRNFVHPLKIKATDNKAYQDKIAHILATLDYKVHNNNKIISELESMAKPFMTTGSFSLNFQTRKENHINLLVEKWSGIKN